MRRRVAAGNGPDALLENGAPRSRITAVPDRRSHTGQYARRAGFFYEYLTGRTLDFAGVTAGNYVASIDPGTYLTATHSINHPRWRVRDNLPGSREFCPLVPRTLRVQEAERYDCQAQLAALEAEFGADILQRSAVWLTIKESVSGISIIPTECQCHPE